MESQSRPAVRNRITGPGGGGVGTNTTGNFSLHCSLTQFVTTRIPSGRGGRRSLGDRLGGEEGGERREEEEDVVNKSVMSRVVKVTGLA